MKGGFIKFWDVTTTLRLGTAYYNQGQCVRLVFQSSKNV